MVEAIVSTILEKLKEMAIDKASEAWNLVKDVEEEVKRLQSNFEALQLVLEDAEEKEYLDKFLKHWLDRFKDVSYDMEDVLDDWQTAVLQPQALQTEEIETGTSGFAPWLKVCDPFFTCFSSGFQVVRRHDIATRIKEINKEVEKIVQDKARFELVKKETKQPQRSETTAFGDMSELIGRDTVKDDMIRTLLCGASEGEEGSRSIPTMSIVGMGGLGKTALAQLIYNDERVKAHFSKIIWVSVGHPFDQTQIARAILQSLDPDSTILLHNSAPLHNLLEIIKMHITNKKFFLVLDDVWTDSDQDWKELKATLKNCMYGSWILVTTRKESFATQMDRSHVFPLEQLADKVCWSIIAQNAFTATSRNDRKNLEEIGWELAKKCKGLPLAAKALGSLLQDKTGIEEWQNVLNSEIWRPDFEKEIFSPLLLSYYDLPSPIRQCLSYCAIFPKNHEFDKDELIQQWMAHGYLNANSILHRQLKGEDYVKYLATRSFFQDVDKDGVGNIISFKMHDLVHDFVQFLTKDRFVSKEAVGDSTLSLSSKRARQLRLIIGGDRSFPRSISGTEKLRSFVVVSDVGYKKATTEALQNLFHQSKRLRLLEFNSLVLDAKEMDNIRSLIHLRYLSLISCSGIKNLPKAACELLNLESLNLRDCHHLERLPDGIWKLIHLKHLSLISCNKIQYLPEAVCELLNLQSLNLQHCRSLQKLPHGIGKLINLRYLCTEGCPLTDYPKGISNLTSLIRLSDIQVRADCNDADKFSIGDLEKLDLLGGNLSVELIGDEIDRNEARRANLRNKKHLKSLVIWLSSPHIKEREVHEALNPPSGLQLRFRNYEAWLQMTGIKEKIRLALYVQKAALGFINAVGPAGILSEDKRGSP